MNLQPGLSIFLVILSAGAGMRPETTLLSRSEQLVLVTTLSWDGIQGTLQRYERSSPRLKWRKIGEPIAVVVGRNGLGWSDASLSRRREQDPIKKEGDGKSPAGVFPLTSAFGYEDVSTAGAFKLPYIQATTSIECVDDAASSHYNQVLDRTGVGKPDWNSSEQMRRSDDLYRLGVVVGHNQERRPGRGSCIFLHIW